jgi:RNase P/RNase MRP subunit POP5
MVRLKHRYVICQILEDVPSSNNTYTTNDIMNAIKDKLSTFMGDYGAMYSCQVRYYDINSRIFIMRTNREAEVHMKAAVSMLTIIKKTNIIIRSLATCGSSRSCIEKLKILLDLFVSGNSNNNDSDIEKYKAFYSTQLATIEI